MNVPSAVALGTPRPDVEAPLAALESWAAREPLVVWTDRDGAAFKAGVGLGDVSGHGAGATARDLLRKLWAQSLDDAARVAAEQTSGRASA